jgi:hypothetical protein
VAHPQYLLLREDLLLLVQELAVAWGYLPWGNLLWGNLVSHLQQMVSHLFQE